MASEQEIRRESVRSYEANEDLRAAYKTASAQSTSSKHCPSNTRDLSGARSRRSSWQAPQLSPQPAGNMQQRSRPVQDAVKSAFESTETAPPLAPEQLQQICDYLIKDPRLAGLAAGAASPQRKDVTEASTDVFPPPPRDVYTPPSPTRDNDIDPVPMGMDGSWDRPAQRGRPSESRRSPSPPRALPRETSERPGVLRNATDEETTLEKIWQPLFDKSSNPTARLGQLLRGLALHIIEDFEPKNSIVISPSKMMRFYEEMKISREVYPWHTLFGGTVRDSSISHMYRDLGCQHHFIQPRGTREKPTMPALTPEGFATWMTFVICAHPDEEYERFAKAVLHMPISNADDSRERFPKELSRRLFPKTPCGGCWESLDDAIMADRDMNPDEVSPPHKGQFRTITTHSHHVDGPEELAKAPTKSEQPSSTNEARTASMPPTTSGTGRPTMWSSQISKTSAPPSEVAISEADEDEIRAPIQIERERKPYYAQPGGGKVYDNDGTNETASGVKPASRTHSISSNIKPAVEESLGRTRTNSHVAAPPSSFRRDKSPGLGISGTRLHSTSSYPRGDSEPQGTPHHAEDSEDEHSLRRTRSERTRRYRPSSFVLSSGGPSTRVDDRDEYYRRGSTASSGYNASNYPYGNSSKH